MGVLVKKKKTLQEPLSIQVDLNQGIKDWLILLYLTKQLMKKESKIHNVGFLISPTTHLFPHVGQSGSCGVSSMIAFQIKIWNNEKCYQSIQSFITRLSQSKKQEKKNKKGEMDADPPWGDGEWAQKSLLERINFIIISYNIIKLNYSLL